MIAADKREYRKGYTRHYAALKVLDDKRIYSRRLLLFYGVECGLKYLLMDMWGVMNTRQLEDDEEYLDVLKSHNLNLMLKALGQQGMVKFSPFQTCHGDTVDASTYHQAYRYGIGIDKRAGNKEIQFEQELALVAQWIDGRV